MKARIADLLNQGLSPAASILLRKGDLSAGDIDFLFDSCAVLADLTAGLLKVYKRTLRRGWEAVELHQTSIALNQAATGAIWVAQRVLARCMQEPAVPGQDEGLKAAKGLKDAGEALVAETSKVLIKWARVDRPAFDPERLAALGAAEKSEFVRFDPLHLARPNGS
jgi:hypothetical protein